MCGYACVQMSELSRFVYIRSHVTLHVKSSAQKVNCALTSPDKKGGNLITKKSAVIKEINALCDLYNLNDIWRKLNPEKQNFTWRTKSFKIQCRLDYFLISNELVPFANNCDIFYASESDHSAVSIYLQSNLFNHKRGPGFWKFNTALLRDETYVTALKMNLPIFKEKYKEIHIEVNDLQANAEKKPA